MSAFLASRRAILLLPLAFPLALAACGDDGPGLAYPRLDYSFLPKFRLNVAHVEIEQRFMPSSEPPSVNDEDPASPTSALRRMGEERLAAFGSAGKAVYVIENAQMTREGDRISGNFAVRLEIYTSAGTRAGFAEASVSRTRTGSVHDLRRTLYELTRQMMDRMNVEFEYQIRRSLGDWLIAPNAVSQPVQAAPIGTGAAPVPTLTPMPSAPAPMQLVPVAPPVLPPAR
ncbi:MAG: hypothetical protein KGI51_04070 [Rhodospirillales bacterium]|nr:hypothetical protein [Rhodospirillales bacterium]